MSPNEIRRRFPHASASVLAANSGDYGTGQPEKQPATTPAVPSPCSPAPTVGGLKTGRADAPAKRAAGLGKPRGRKGMNKTEARYSLRLEQELGIGAISRYDREGLTLRWPDGMAYTPDFVVFHAPTNVGHIELIEVKGAHIRDDALVKFRAARARWTEFAFSMFQFKDKQWTRIL